MGHVHLFKEAHHTMKPWSYSWEPRCKIIACVLFVFGIIALDTWWLAAFALFFVLGAAALMGITMTFLLRRMALLMPFLIFMSIPLILGGGIPPTPDRYMFAALIVMKAMAAMAAMIVLSTSQPVEELLEGMAHLKIPQPIITVIFLAFRYGHLFIRELNTTRKALASRLFYGGLSVSALRIYGELCGSMFIKSLCRSETVYRTMLSRCFDGKLPVTEPRNIIGSDLIKSLTPVAFALFLIVIEQVVL